jgi:hypothetical protein
LIVVTIRIGNRNRIGKEQLTDIHVGQCFKEALLPHVTFRKVATALGNKLWDEAEQKSYNAIVVKSSSVNLPVGWTCTMQFGEVIHPVKDPEQTRRSRNAANRARNAALRELCGTSARAAKEDMGL